MLKHTNALIDNYDIDLTNYYFENILNEHRNYRNYSISPALVKGRAQCAHSLIHQVHWRSFERYSAILQRFEENQSKDRPRFGLFQHRP